MTEFSGRGVGLDAVKVAVEKVGGRVELSSVLGQGSRFRLVLPLTISTIDCLLFEVKDFSFTLPMRNIQAVYDLEQYQDHLVSNNQFVYREKLVKLIDLGQLLFSNPVSDQDSHILVLEGEDDLEIAILISKIISKDNLLLRPIDHPLLKNIKISSSVSILKNGRIASVLDVNAIALLAKQKDLEVSDENL
ncbi:chemotaxis protein CheW [bacterium]|nr:chemotaxis protein CheW [bacterium]